MTENSYVQSIKESLGEQGLDALLLVDPINIRYFSRIHFKHSGSAAMIIFADREPIVYSADLEYETALNETRVDAIKTFGWKEDFNSLLVKALDEAGLGAARVGMVDSSMTVATHQAISQALPNCNLTSFSSAVAAKRGVKTAEEIESITQACRCANTAMQTVIDAAEPGMTERQLAILAEKSMREAGAEDRAFETIFSSGVRTAMCHGFASDKPLTDGDMVMFDLGAIYNGYNSDMTRMATVGAPSAQHQATYDSLRRIYDLLVEETRPGVQVGELLSKASVPVAECRYSDAFICGFGRGIGLTLNEEPTLALQSTLELKPGMVIVFHPAFFLQRQFGLRLESTVLVTDHGAQILTQTPMDLIRI